MSVTALDILRATREYAADPAHIVMEPSSVYEAADGGDTRSADAVRGCLLGCEGIVCRRLGVEDGSPAESAAARAIEKAAGNFMRVMREGHEAILATYDEAIAALEAAS